MKRRRRGRGRMNPLIIILIILVLILGVKVLFDTKDTPLDEEKAEQIKTEQEWIQERAEIDIQKELYKEQKKNAKIFVESVNRETEFIVDTFDGIATQHLDKTPTKDGWWDITNSELNVKTQYKVVMSIPLYKIAFNIGDDGIVHITYRSEDMTVKAVETENTVVEDKAMFGKKYTDDEKEAIKELVKDRIKEVYNTNQEIKLDCQNNLHNTLMDLARKFGVNSVQINENQPKIVTFEYIDQSNVKYGWEDKKVNEVKYIVLHSTANLDSDAERHIHWLNNDPKAKAVHFYIDDNYVMKALDTTKYAHGVGKGGNGILNDNSVQIEICEFADSARQERAIQNAEDFVANTLIPLLEEQGFTPKVVTHFDSTGKNCPRIFFDGVGTEWTDVTTLLNNEV